MRRASAARSGSPASIVSAEMTSTICAASVLSGGRAARASEMTASIRGTACPVTFLLWIALYQLRKVGPQLLELIDELCHASSLPVPGDASLAWSSAGRIKSSCR